jgi:hypothetical protein
MSEEAIDQPPKVFFTYVWGPPGEPAWPLTFANKAGRTQALNRLGAGDLVFTVGTNGEPTRPEYRGRVLGAYQVTDIVVNTNDYGLKSDHAAPKFDSLQRFPFALHPLAVDVITSPDAVFSSLVGPLTPAHHLQAQSGVVELDAITGAALLALDRKPVAIAQPTNELAKQTLARKTSKLAPKHSGSHQVTYGEHDTWYVYGLELREGTKVRAIKIGYSHDPTNRLDDYNMALASEVTGLKWALGLKQATSSEDAARIVEQGVLSKFHARRLASNGEILSGLDPMTVWAEVAHQLKRLSVTTAGAS